MSDSSLLDPARSSMQVPLERAAAVSINDRDVAINAWRGFAALLVAYASLHARASKMNVVEQRALRVAHMRHFVGGHAQLVARMRAFHMQLAGAQAHHVRGQRHWKQRQDYPLHS